MITNPSICFFIINLNNAYKRLEFVRSQIDNYKIPIERVNAIDGKNIKPPYPNYNEKKFNLFFGKKTNPNVIACYYSHLKAIKKFSESNYDLGIILEDDAYICKNFDIYLNDIKYTSNKWDLLRLSATKKSIFFNTKKLKSGNSLTTNLTMLKGTCGYVINKYAAKKLQKGLIPFYLPIDIAIENEWKFTLRTRCLTPFPIEDAIAHKKTDVLISQIPRGVKISRFRFTAKIHNLIQKIFRIFYRFFKSIFNK